MGGRGRSWRDGEENKVGSVIFEFASQFSPPPPMHISQEGTKMMQFSQYRRSLSAKEFYREYIGIQYLTRSRGLELLTLK